MSTHIRLAAALLASLHLAPTHAAAGETLTMKFRPGDRYGYQISQNMSVAGQSQGREVKSEMRQKLHISTDIKSVGADGSARAEQTVDRVQLTLVVPPPLSQTIEYDTDNDDAPQDEMTRQVAANLDRMVGEAISMTISPRGEMSDVQIPEKVKQSQGTPGAALSSEERLKQMFKQAGLRLPPGEVSEGESWEQDTQMDLDYGTMEITTTYTYQGKDARGLDKIGARMDLRLKQKENAQIPVNASTKEAEGSFLFDNNTGRLTSSEVNQVLEIEIGAVAKQTVTTQVKMNLTDGRSQEQ